MLPLPPGNDNFTHNKHCQMNNKHCQMKGHNTGYVMGEHSLLGGLVGFIFRARTFIHPPTPTKRPQPQHPIWMLLVPMLKAARGGCGHRLAHRKP